MANAISIGKGPLVKTRLSTMMFLQYAVWGAWLPPLARYLGADPVLNEAGARIGGGLGFTGVQIGIIAGTAGAVGAVTAPFIAGQIADRYFSAERFMFLLMVIGGVIKFYLAGLDSFMPWLWLSIVYSIIYCPTLALSNSLAFSHLSDPDREFPPIRVWGTIGWIVVSWVFPMVWLQTGLHVQWMPPFVVGMERHDVVARLADAIRFAGVLSIVYGLFCLMLPHTPPTRSTEKIAFAKAFRLFATNRGLLVVTLVALPISVIHTIYFIQTAQFLPTLHGVRDADIQPAMTIGQFSEIAVLAVLGLFLKRLGFRTVLMIGCLAYFARYAIFALGAPTWLVVSSQALHGLCYGCFFAGAFIYVERVATVDVRHSAQTVFGIMILGLGPMLAGPAVGWMVNASMEKTTIAACVETVNVIPQEPPDARDEPKDAPKGWNKLYPTAKADMDAYAEAHPADKASSWKGLKPSTQVEALNYKRFWLINALIGLVSGLLLVVLFRRDPAADEAKPTLAEAAEHGAEAGPIGE